MNITWLLEKSAKEKSLINEKKYPLIYIWYYKIYIYFLRLIFFFIYNWTCFRFAAFDDSFRIKYSHKQLSNHMSWRISNTFCTIATYECYVYKNRCNVKYEKLLTVNNILNVTHNFIFYTFLFSFTIKTEILEQHFIHFSIFHLKFQNISFL